MLLAAGCARYEFPVLEAPAIEGQDTPVEVVSATQEVTVERLPLRYRLQVVENRLVVRVFNSSDRVVELVGGRSTVVDPIGQSRGLRNQVLTPGAFVKLVLPPLRSEPVRNDGLSVSGRGGYGPGLDRGEFGFGVGYTTPDRSVPRDRGDTWDWSGEGQVRLNLVFREVGTTEEWTHSFRFGRRRAN